jgi:hypothetical protein
LDTSGSAKTFLKFTGMKKVGKEWVDVWNDEEGSERKKGRKGYVSTSNEPDANTAAAAVSYTTIGDTTQLDAAPMDARARRLVRRTQPRQNIAIGSWTGTPGDTKPVSIEEVSKPTEIITYTSSNTATCVGSSQQTNSGSHDTAKSENRDSDEGTPLPQDFLEEESLRAGRDDDNEALNVSAKARQNEGESQYEHDLTTSLDDVSKAYQEAPAFKESTDVPLGLPEKIHFGSTDSNAGDMSVSYDRPPAARTQIGPYNDKLERRNGAIPSSQSVHSTEAHPVSCAEGHA